MRRLLGLLSVIFVLSATKCFGYEVYFDRNQLSKIVINRPLPYSITYNMLAMLPADTSNPKALYKLFFNKNRWIATKDGYFDVFIWDGQQWKNNYEGIYKGYNFGSYVFIHLGELYSLGGYGFWNHHLNLIKFDFASGGWEIVHTSHTPIGILPMLTTMNNNKIYVVLGQRRIETNNEFTATNNVYVLDLKSKSWSIVSYSSTASMTEFPLLLPKFETPEYTFLPSYNYNSCGLFCWDKKNKILLFATYSDGSFQVTPLAFITKTNIIYYNNKINKFISIDLRSLIEHAIVVAKPRQIVKIAIEISLAILLLLAAVSLAFYFRKKKKDKLIKALKNSDALTYRYFQMLSTKKGKILTTDELDKLFDINELDYDARRVRRSTLIQQINAYSTIKTGENILQRQRSDSDKRYISYQIK